MNQKTNHAGAIVKAMTRVFAIIIMLVVFQTAAYASFMANVYRVSMPVYSSPKSTGKKLGALPSGTEVTVTAYSGDWCKIKYKGRTGYAQIKYLSSQKRIKAYTNGKAAVYKLPSSSSKKLGTLAKGNTVYVVGMCDKYFLIENENGTASGYIKKTDLTAKKPSAGTSETAGNTGSKDSKYKNTMPSSLKSDQSSCSDSTGKADRIEYVIYVAQAQLGKPYSSSPSVPSSFDCARFTKYCFSKADVSVKSSAYGQGYDSSFSKIKSASSLKRGDVVIFNTNDSDSDLSDHTGIYLGGGYFIHASSGAGQVIVSSLSSGYYEDTFSWGLRIID